LQRRGQLGSGARVSRCNRASQQSWHPFLSWHPDARFTFNLPVKGLQPAQIPAIGNATANLPRHWSANDPAQWNLFPETSLRGLYTGDWTWKLNNHWRVAQRFLYHRQHEEQRYVIDTSFNER